MAGTSSPEREWEVRWKGEAIWEEKSKEQAKDGVLQQKTEAMIE